MRLHLDRPAVVCTAAVSLLTAVVAVAPSTARADDTLPTQLPSVASLADAATTAATDVVTAAPLPDTTSGTGPAAGLDSAAVVDATEPAPSEPSVAVPSGDASTQAPASTPDPVTETVVAGDITAATTDTTTDTPPAATQPEPPAPSTGPTTASAPGPASANINVSVRVDSPGDNGPVSQINLVGASVTPLSTAPAQAKTASTPSPGGATQGSASPTAPPATGGSSDAWYWSWDCLGAVPISAIPQGGSGSGSLPSSWTWIWNCADNSSQYQTETPSGYSQVNTNIAIRISSPGNDDSVSQVNIGAGVSIPVPVPVHGAPFPASPVNLPPALETALGDVLPAPGLALVAAPSVDTTDITAVLDSGVGSAGPVSATPVAAPAAPARVPTLQAGPRQARGFPSFRIPLAPNARFTPAGTSAVDAAWRASSPASSDSPKEPARPPEATPRHRAPREPSRAPAISVSGVSASAAAGGGGSSGSGGLPLLLTLPFVAALLDLARRVALEHATWPSGHRRRVPDRPG